MHCHNKAHRSVSTGVLIMTISIFFGLAVISAPDAKADNIAAKVQTACSTCHSLQRVCKNLENKSRDEWAATVNRMLDKEQVLQGPDVTDAINFLSSSKAGTPEICQ